MTLAIHGGPPACTGPPPRWPEWGEPERAALERVLETGNWGGFPSPNEQARAFSDEFAQYLGAVHVVTCTNGTDAIELALQAARVSPGAEVITTAYSFVATAAAIAQSGCIPVPVDIQPDTYCIDPDLTEAAITDRTEAIVVVHLGCAMADLDRFRELADRRGLLLIEDCAHAPGARWRGRAAGTWGDLGTFSMQSSKLLTAGEGGAITTGEAMTAERLQSLVNCGRREPGYQSFPERMLGHNRRITEWQAALLREQLRRLPEQHARRARNFARFEAGLVELDGLQQLGHDDRTTTQTHYQVVVRYDASAFEGVVRDHAVLALQAEGVRCSGRFYLPIGEDPLFALDPATNPLARERFTWRKTDFPVTRRAAYDEAIWLPHELFLGTECEVDEILDAFFKLHAGAAALRDKAPEVDAT
ncbi:MAG: DegT/DnrJ/EryC1/StrS family aminotransferase [Myxococcota bacterium]